jgi:hypothetical protein
MRTAADKADCEVAVLRESNVALGTHGAWLLLSRRFSLLWLFINFINGTAGTARPVFSYAAVFTVLGAQEAESLAAAGNSNSTRLHLVAGRTVVADLSLAVATLCACVDVVVVTARTPSVSLVAELAESPSLAQEERRAALGAERLLFGAQVWHVGTACLMRTPVLARLRFT